MSLTRKQTLLYLIFLLLIPLIVHSQENPLFEVTATKYLMGTIVDMKAMHSEIMECKKSFYFAFREIERVENLLSSPKPDSEISKVNVNAGLAPVKVSKETFRIIQRSVDFSKKSDGFFDVSIGAITDLWGFNGENEIKIPKKDALDSLLISVNYKNIILNEADTTVFFASPNMNIDLGGIAKGYAVDRAAKILKERNVEHFLINAGGDIYVAGFKYDDQKWAIGLKHPRKTDDLIAKVELNDFAVATSGDYERFAEINGKRYHHILNPKTGYPSNLCQSVTIFAPTVEEADAFATFLFVVGYDYFQQKNHQLKYFIVNSTGQIHFDEVLLEENALEVLE